MAQYIIKTTRHFYSPATDKVGYYSSDYGYFGPRRLARRMSFAAAQELVYELENEEYRTARGEHSRPTYSIVRA